MAKVLNSKGGFLFKIAEKKKNQILFFVFGSLSLMIMVTIFLFSEQSAANSQALSDQVGSIIQNILSFFEWIFNENVIAWITTYIRKIAHFLLYALLGGFLQATFLNTRIKKIYLKMVFSASIGLFYSITDEIHQLFNYGRSGQISDVILDFSGVVFGITISFLIYKIIKFSTKCGKKSKS